MLAGIQAAMILAHNRRVDELAAAGTPVNQRFALARRDLTHHYQWLILHEFLPLSSGRRS